MSQILLQDAVVFLAPPVASTVTLAALHWFPWHGGIRPLSRVVAYALGTGVTVGVPVITMVLTAALGLAYGSLFWAALLLANAFISGAAVGMAYWIDGHRALTLDDWSEAHRAESRP
jgi:hypothetical protein